MKLIVILTLSIICCRTVFAKDMVQPGVTEAIYKTVGATKLKLYIYQPQNHDKGERIPAIIFFTEEPGVKAMRGSFFLNANLLRLME